MCVEGGLDPDRMGWGLESCAERALAAMQTDMLAKARKQFDESIVRVTKWEDYVQDGKAQGAAAKLRQAVATHTPLMNPDYEAARDYVQSGRPFILFVDASDFGYSGVLCQADSNSL